MTPDVSAWERAGRPHTLQSRRDFRVICSQLRFKLLPHFERTPFSRRWAEGGHRPGEGSPTNGDAPLDSLRSLASAWPLPTMTPASSPAIRPLAWHHRCFAATKECPALESPQGLASQLFAELGLILVW